MIIIKRKARKSGRWVCYNCQKKIEKGEEYYSVESPFQRLELGMEAFCLDCGESLLEEDIKEHLDLGAFDKSLKKEREEDERLNRLKEEEMR